jgi:hypothetical protein
MVTQPSRVTTSQIADQSLNRRLDIRGSFHESARWCADRLAVSCRTSAIAILAVTDVADRDDPGINR